MMTSAIARVPTPNGSKYSAQLCKHWAHKLDVSSDGDVSVIRFPSAEARLIAEADVLVVTVAAEDEATVERMKGVVSTHLDRFAFREAPLTFDWT